MKEAFIRTGMLVGDTAMQKIFNARIAVFGIGGVGGNCAEALVRSGVGTLDLIDDDAVCESNLNRQVFALRSTLGQKKVDAARQRLLDINPEASINTYSMFYLPGRSSEISFSDFDFVVDAIDTVTAKLDIIEHAVRLDIPIISAMGCGNRLDPSRLRITDIYDTASDPLARIMRRELRKRGIEKLNVCCSEEPPIKPEYPEGMELPEGKRQIPGSSAFVPPAAGLLIASWVIRQIIEKTC